MERSEPFPIDSAIAWRSRPGGDVGYVFACRVLADGPNLAAVVQPTGASVVRRVARRGGPNGRSAIPGTWDGSRREARWDGPTTVRLHPVGRAYSVIRTFDPAGRYRGWYVNLEQPWVRTTVGYDSRDDVLDVTVDDDLAACRLKDEDELEFAVDLGSITPAEARSIRATAESAIDDVLGRRWPFDESAWTALPPPGISRPDLPVGWDVP